ncbi:MAG: TonB-dependent receptor [Proteobacteria bacterium]|nr:TonB-dependent receptor [Pseudomonadota bacterium]MBU1714236.1 TonB-dependent receptor [Pseudomonadota bacterium]
MVVRKDIWLVLLGLFLLLPLTSQAGEIEEDDSEAITSLLEMDLEQLTELEVELATGTSKPINLAPAVASVITAEQIEQLGARSIQEVLEMVPGLHVTPSSKNAMSPTYSIRGIQTSVNPQVLILQDGVPISAAYYGSRPSFRQPVANILRIEVVRGPGSAVHGADAFAGVINIITKDGQAINGSHFGARAGSFDSYDAWLQHGKTYAGWDLGLNLEYQESRGDHERVLDADLQTALDAPPPAGFGTSASLAPGALDTSYQTINSQLSLAKGNWTMRLWGMHQDDGGVDGVTQTLGDNNVETEQVVASLNYDNQELLNDLDLKIRVHYNYYKQESALQLFPAGSVLMLGADGNINFVTPTSMATFTDGVYGTPVQIDHQLGLELTTLYEGFAQNLWRFGVGYTNIKEETEEYKNFGPGTSAENLTALPTLNVIDGTLYDLTGTEDIYMEDQERSLWFLSVQDEWAFTRGWELTAGLRYDHYSDFGDTVNPRAALVWETRYDLTTKLMYGRAFRPPSFTELYAQNNPANKGNTDLKPETIETVELAFDYQPTTNLRTGLNLFVYEIDDLIELVQDQGQTTAIAQNHKNQEGRGFELELDWLTTDTLRLRSNFAYQRSKDKETGEVVPDAPEMQFYAGANWKFLPKWSFDSQYYWVGKRHRASGDTRPDIKDNDIVNLILRRKNIAKYWEAALAVRNLFDEDVREPSLSSIPNDYPMESRSVWAELRASF